MPSTGGRGTGGLPAMVVVEEADRVQPERADPDQVARQRAARLAGADDDVASAGSQRWRGTSVAGVVVS